jgi:hypothetical protein
VFLGLKTGFFCYSLKRAKTNFNYYLLNQNPASWSKQWLQVLFHIVMAKFPIPENCSAYVPMILKEFCSSKFNGLVMKTFSGK